MDSPVRRSVAFAAVGTLTLLAPALGRFAALPFAALAVLAVATPAQGRLFELFAGPRDRRAGRLYDLAGFALAVAALAVLLFPDVGYPAPVFATSVCVLVYGALGERLLSRVRQDPASAAGGFVVAGTVGGTLAALVVGAGFGTALSPPVAVFLAVSGALLAAVVRSILRRREDPLVLLLLGVVLWLFATITAGVTREQLAVAVAVVGVLAAVSYRLETASVTGMLTGALLALVTIVLADFRWFAALIVFFAIGGLSSKFRYDEKRERGVAEENEGARGVGNVLANAAVAFLAVIGFATADAFDLLLADLFRYAFLGALATALADTLGSEIGGVYDGPRLITTLQRVEPGTDGGVTWQGFVAGVAGAAMIGGLAAGLFDGMQWLGAMIVVASGLAGMNADSLLGATVEGGVLGNQTVNFLATLTGAIVGVGLAVGLGAVAMPPTMLWL